MPIVLRGLAAAIALAVSAAAQAQANPNEGWPAGERLIAEYKAGHYAIVIAESPATLRAEPWNKELRLAYGYSLLWSGQERSAVDQFRMLVDEPGEIGSDARLGLANGLAWSGRMSAALPEYRLLFQGPHAGEARQGYANALRWMGRDDLALPIYEQLRKDYPGEDVGKEGLYLAQRATRTRTTLGTSYLHDNTPMSRHEPQVTHSWRMFDNSVIVGLEGGAGRDWSESFSHDRREYGASLEALAVPLAPRLWVSRQTEPTRRTYGELRLTLADWPVYLYVGRVNWGKLAFTIPAEELGLEADRIGLQFNHHSALGEFRGFANHYRVKRGEGLFANEARSSPDNTVDNAEVRLLTRWTALPRQVRPFIGVHWRRADHTDPFYWSPENYVLGFVGVEGEWESRDWTLNASAQVGGRISGEASTSWGAAVFAKRWLSADWAVGLKAYAQSGTQQSKYRAEGASAFIEKLW